MRLGRLGDGHEPAFRQGDRVRFRDGAAVLLRQGRGTRGRPLRRRLLLDRRRRGRVLHRFRGHRVVPAGARPARAAMRGVGRGFPPGERGGALLHGHGALPGAHERGLGPGAGGAPALQLRAGGRGRRAEDRARPRVEPLPGHEGRGVLSLRGRPAKLRVPAAAGARENRDHRPHNGEYRRWPEGERGRRALPVGVRERGPGAHAGLHHRGIHVHERGHGLRYRAPARP